MEYIFMHQDIPVAKLEINEISGAVQKIKQVLRPEHLPPGVLVKKGWTDLAAFREWWDDRCIPMRREGVSEAMKRLYLKDSRQLVLKSFGLSLSDQYWIRPTELELSWEQINFFEHSFSEMVGDALFGIENQENGMQHHTLNDDFETQQEERKGNSLISPDNTTDGYLKKRWKIIDGKRYLFKGGSAPFYQQPFNEVIASELMNLLGVRHVPYTLSWENGMPYSVCEDFLTKDTELITAWHIMKTQKQSNSTSVYQHVINCYEELGMSVIHELEQMIVIDYLIANEDRHLNNFGLIRNASSLQWLGTAPIFDSGSSLGYDKNVWDIRSGWGITCKPFKRYHEKQLELVRSFSWINFEKLSDVKEIICNTLSGEQAREFVNERRACTIADSAEQRVKKLKEYVQRAEKEHNPVMVQKSTQDDVTENIAEDYTN